MNRETIVTLLTKTNQILNTEANLNLAGTHGVSLVMHGIKKTTEDLDVVVLDDATRQWVTMNVEPEMVNGLPKYELGHFDFGFLSGDGGCFDQLSPLTEIDIVTIDGVKCVSLERILAEKRLLGRPKDIKAIKLIEAYMAK